MSGVILNPQLLELLESWMKKEKRLILFVNVKTRVIRDLIKFCRKRCHVFICGDHVAWKDALTQYSQGVFVADDWKRLAEVKAPGNKLLVHANVLENIHALDTSPRVSFRTHESSAIRVYYHGQSTTDEIMMDNEVRMLQSFLNVSLVSDLKFADTIFVSRALDLRQMTCSMADLFDAYLNGIPRLAAKWTSEDCTEHCIIDISVTKPLRGLLFYMPIAYKFWAQRSLAILELGGDVTGNPGHSAITVLPSAAPAQVDFSAGQHRLCLREDFVDTLRRNSFFVKTDNVFAPPLRKPFHLCNTLEIRGSKICIQQCKAVSGGKQGGRSQEFGDYVRNQLAKFYVEFVDNEEDAHYIFCKYVSDTPVTANHYSRDSLDDWLVNGASKNIERDKSVIPVYVPTSHLNLFGDKKHVSICKNASEILKRMGSLPNKVPLEDLSNENLTNLQYFWKKPNLKYLNLLTHVIKSASVDQLEIYKLDVILDVLNNPPENADEIKKKHLVSTEDLQRFLAKSISSRHSGASENESCLSSTDGSTTLAVPVHIPQEPLRVDNILSVHILQHLTNLAYALTMKPVSIDFFGDEPLEAPWKGIAAIAHASKICDPKIFIGKRQSEDLQEMEQFLDALVTRFRKIMVQLGIEPLIIDTDERISFFACHSALGILQVGYCQRTIGQPNSCANVVFFSSIMQCIESLDVLKSDLMPLKLVRICLKSANADHKCACQIFKVPFNEMLPPYFVQGNKLQIQASLSPVLILECDGVENSEDCTLFYNLGKTLLPNTLDVHVLSNFKTYIWCHRRDQEVALVKTSGHVICEKCAHEKYANHISSGNLIFVGTLARRIYTYFCAEEPCASGKTNNTVYLFRKGPCRAR